MSKKMGIRVTASNKGFVFTMEAALSLLMLALMIAALPQPNSLSLKELAIAQQANDLLRVWSAKNTSELEMSADVNKIFSKNAELWINGIKLLNSGTKTNSIATEGILLDDFLAEKKVKIVVHYN